MLGSMASPGRGGALVPTWGNKNPSDVTPCDRRLGPTNKYMELPEFYSSDLIAAHNH